MISSACGLEHDLDVGGDDRSQQRQSLLNGRPHGEIRRPRESIWRLNVRIRVTRLRARCAAATIRVRSLASALSAGASFSATWEYSRIGVRMLLNSWATPPARVPMAGDPFAVQQLPFQIQALALGDLALADLALQALVGADELLPHGLEVVVELLHLANASCSSAGSVCTSPPAIRLAASCSRTIGLAMTADSQMATTMDASREGEHRGQHPSLGRAIRSSVGLSSNPSRSTTERCAALHRMRDVIDLVALVAKVEIVPRSAPDVAAEGQRAVDSRWTVDDLGVNHLAWSA